MIRLLNLERQVLAGDELYAVEAALRRPIAELLVTYQLKDPCLPLSALYRLFLDLGMPLSEGLLRAPILLSGFVVLLLVPLYAERRITVSTAVIVAWLLALSPILVLYSRIVRPYGPLVPLTFGAVVAFDAWWRRPRFGAGALYVVLAGLSAYFHLGSTPYVLAPIPFALAGRLLRPNRFPSFLATGLLGFGALLALSSFLVPSWDSLSLLIESKRNPLEVDVSTLAGVAALQAGSRSVPAVVLFWLLASSGLGLLLRHRPDVGLLGLVLVGGQIAGLLYVSPEMLAHPMVFNRYLMPTIPWVLLWVASALAALGAAAPDRSRRATTVAATILVLGLLVSKGPLVEPFFRQSSFVHHNDFVSFFCPRARLPTVEVPAFYEQLSASSPGPIVELPYHRWWAYMRLPYLYQEIHRREVLVGMVPGLDGWQRLDLRNTVAPTPRALLESPAAFVVVHRDLPAEEDRVLGHCRPMVPQMRRPHRGFLRGAGQRKLRELRAVWGEPDHADSRIAVWDLARIRR